MARWKAHVEFLLRVIELPFLSLTVEALEGKMCQNSLPSGGVGHLEPRFQGEGVVPGNIFFGFYKPRDILLSESANCTVLRTVVLTQYRHVQTDGQTDGIAVASTALAMRALRRAVKTLASSLILFTSIIHRSVNKKNRLFTDNIYALVKDSRTE